MSFLGTISQGSDFAPLFRFLDDYDVHRASRAVNNRSSNTNGKLCNCQDKCEGQCQGKCQGKCEGQCQEKSGGKCKCSGSGSGVKGTPSAVKKATTPSPSRRRAFSPRFDVRETNTAYCLDGEIPGTEQKNIDIEFTEPQTLTIKGHSEREYSTPSSQQEETDQTDGHKYWATERSVGQFRRAFSFPSRVDQDNVKANLQNGVLSIVVPKAAAPAVKKIIVE